MSFAEFRDIRFFFEDKMLCSRHTSVSPRELLEIAYLRSIEHVTNRRMTCVKRSIYCQVFASRRPGSCFIESRCMLAPSATTVIDCTTYIRKLSMKKTYNNLENDPVCFCYPFCNIIYCNCSCICAPLIVYYYRGTNTSTVNHRDRISNIYM